MMERPKGHLAAAAAAAQAKLDKAAWAETD
jgi:hypothetical protein